MGLKITVPIDKPEARNMLPSKTNLSSEAVKVNIFGVLLWEKWFSSARVSRKALRKVVEKDETVWIGRKKMWARWRRTVRKEGDGSVTNQRSRTCLLTTNKYRKAPSDWIFRLFLDVLFHSKLHPFTSIDNSPNYLRVNTRYSDEHVQIESEIHSYTVTIPCPMSRSSRVQIMWLRTAKILFKWPT